MKTPSYLVTFLAMSGIVSFIIFLFLRFQHSLAFTIGQLKDAGFTAPMSGLETSALLTGLVCFVISGIVYKGEQNTPNANLSLS